MCATCPERVRAGQRRTDVLTRPSYVEQMCLAPKMQSKSAATSAVWAACCELVGKEASEIDENMSMFDMGIDSLGLAELVIQLEEIYGEGALTIDDVLANLPRRVCSGRQAGWWRGRRRSQE